MTSDPLSGLLDNEPFDDCDCNFFGSLNNTDFSLSFSDENPISSSNHGSFPFSSCCPSSSSSPLPFALDTSLPTSSRSSPSPPALPLPSFASSPSSHLPLFVPKPSLPVSTQPFPLPVPLPVSPFSSYTQFVSLNHTSFLHQSITWPGGGMDSQRPFPPFVPSLSLKQQNQTTPPHSPSSALSLGKRVPSDSMEEQNLQAAEEKKEKEEKKKKNVEKEEKEEEKKKDSEGKKVKRVINSIRDKEEDKIRYDDRKMCACRECPKLYFSTNRKIYCSKKCQYREQNLILGRVKENKEKVLERQLKIQGLRKNKKVMKTNIDEDVK